MSRNIADIRGAVLKHGKADALIWAAATVANAIHAGAGSLIRGSLMEDDLRTALTLMTGELVTFPFDEPAP